MILAYEGYIRNRKKLSEELGIAYAYGPDIEIRIIEEGYKRWGYDLANHLHGSFAIVIKDEKKDEIFCVRDPFGIKSLYYYASDDVFLTDTRITPIASDKRYKKELDLEAAYYYMMFGYPLGENTLYKGIKKLLPGRYLVYRGNECLIRRYFAPAFNPEENISEDKWTELIGKTIKDVISEDLENHKEENISSFLSGGVDSAYLLAASGVKHACGIGYPGDEASEFEAAGKTAAYVGSNFHKITVSADEFFKAIPEFVRNTELPASDPSSLVFSIGCRKLADEGVKVSFSGEGADEFFAGYYVYRRAEELYKTGYYGCFGVMDQNTAAKLLKLEKQYDMSSLLKVMDEVKAEDPLSLMLATDISLWLEGDIFFGVGNAARATGIELLLPFSDRRVFELSAKIPSDLKLKDNQGKYIFRKAALDILPEETAWRAKAGFPVPIRKWLLDESARKNIEEMFIEGNTPPFINADVLRKYWNSFCNGNDVLYQIIYSSFIFYKWYNEVFLR